MVTAVVTRLTVTEPALVGWPLPEIWHEISAVGGIPAQLYVSGKTVVPLLVVRNPVELVTVTSILAVPPTLMGNVLAVDVSVKLSVVLLTVRLMTAVTSGELVGMIVIVCAPAGSAMLAMVEIVTVVVALFTPSKLTLGGLKLQVAPAGRPVQLLGLKFTTIGTEPLTAEMVKVADATPPLTH